MNCLLGRQFTWNAKTGFLWKKNFFFECRLLQILLGTLRIKVFIKNRSNCSKHTYYKMFDQNHLSTSIILLQKKTCIVLFLLVLWENIHVPSEDSDQPVHLCLLSLVLVDSAKYYNASSDRQTKKLIRLHGRACWPVFIECAYHCLKTYFLN